MFNLAIMGQLTIISSSKGSETWVNIVPVPTQDSSVETSALGFFLEALNMSVSI